MKLWEKVAEVMLQGKWVIDTSTQDARVKVPVDNIALNAQLHKKNNLN